MYEHFTKQRVINVLMYWASNNHEDYMYQKGAIHVIKNQNLHEVLSVFGRKINYSVDCDRKNFWDSNEFSFALLNDVNQFIPYERKESDKEITKIWFGNVHGNCVMILGE